MHSADKFVPKGTTTGRLPDSDWRQRAQFYRAGDFQPCCICGSYHQIGIEPRFNYAVCEEHSKLSPVQVGERRVDLK